MRRLFATLGLLLAALSPTAALADADYYQGRSASGIPQPVVNGNCLIGSGGVAVWGSCSGSGTAVTLVSNSDGTLTISPTSGNVVASINLGHANTWSGQQTFVAPILGTPASGNAANLTNLPISGIAGLGTGVGTFLGSPAGNVPNSWLTNAATTVNGQTCTLGSTCTISAAASLVVGSTAITSGTTGRLLYDNGGVLGELILGTNLSITGSTLNAAGGGSITATAAGNTQTGVTTFAFGNGFTTPSGSSGNAPINLSVTDTTKSGDFSVDATHMANALKLTGSHTMTLPTASSTIFAPGMTLSVVSTGTWTVTNSTGLTYAGPTTLRPGMWGTFVANADGTTLDWYGVQVGTASVFGVYEIDGTSITAPGGVLQANTGGGGTVTVVGSGSLTSNALVTGGGSQTLQTITTGTGILTALGINTGSAGAPVLFNGAGGTPSSLALTNATGLPQTGIAASTFATGTTHTFVAPAEIWECTGTCTVTPPTPAAGYQFCVRNANNVATVITLAAVASTLYEKTSFTAYGTANTAGTSGGAAGDKICIIGKDSTHYDVMSYNGTWTFP